MEFFPSLSLSLFFCNMSFLGLINPSYLIHPILSLSKIHLIRTTIVMDYIVRERACTISQFIYTFTDPKKNYESDNENIAHFNIWFGPAQKNQRCPSRIFSTNEIERIMKLKSFFFLPLHQIKICVMEGKEIIITYQKGSTLCIFRYVLLKIKSF